MSNRSSLAPISDINWLPWQRNLKILIPSVEATKLMQMLSHAKTKERNFICFDEILYGYRKCQLMYNLKMCVVTFRHLFDVQNSTAFMPEVNKIVRKHVCPKYNLCCITQPLARLSKCGGFLNTSFNTQNSQSYTCLLHQTQRIFKTFQLTF
jgi:hypothetical protein